MIKTLDVTIDLYEEFLDRARQCYEEFHFPFHVFDCKWLAEELFNDCEIGLLDELNDLADEDVRLLEQCIQEELNKEYHGLFQAKSLFLQAISGLPLRIVS